MEKLLIFDLDDTIFETKSIGTEAVAPIIERFELILNGYYEEKQIRAIVEDLWKYPFDFLVSSYSFDPQIVLQFASLIDEADFLLDIQPFEDFELVVPFRKERKILVTTGFEKLQQSKIDALGIRTLFDKIIIDNQGASERIYKKGIFEKILNKDQIPKDEILIIGDNPDSELKAGYELGISTVQVAKLRQPKSSYATNFIHDYQELIPIIEA